MLLCGQRPETALASALASVQFYVTQQQMQAQLRESQLNKKLMKVQEACRRKVEEVHKAYTQTKRKYEEAMQCNEQIQQDKQDLQAKYAQKSMQARKLQEMVKNMQHDMEALRASNAKIPVLGGAPGTGRTPLSPLAPGDVVTTVQRTQVFANLSSPPALGGYGGGKHQTVVPSSGRVQGITGGYRVQHGGHSAGCSGDVGGFLGGSFSAGSPIQSVHGLGRTSPLRAGPGVGMRHVNGAITAGQDPNNSALRKILGMAPAQNGLLGGRNMGSTRPDLFSM
ncbi:hypothetical protein Vretifemale_2893 [Volvox reticuliferus]|nr:hypothetical protein Vretifemale_2893 [Volvox reticuliferus]